MYLQGRQVQEEEVVVVKEETIAIEEVEVRGGSREFGRAEGGMYFNA